MQKTIEIWPDAMMGSHDESRVKLFVSNEQETATSSLRRHVR